MPCPRTALRVGPEGASHLEAHVGRLKAGAASLGKAVGWLDAAGEELKAWLWKQTPRADLALRLCLAFEPERLLAELEPLPQHSLPYRLVPMAHPMAPRQQDPATRHKGLCGPWSTGMLAAARHAGRDDALLTWPDGTLAETAIASIGLEVDGVLLLPPAAGRVASLTEALDLPAWAAARGLRMQQEPIPAARIAGGHVWCMNALRGIWPGTVS